MPNDSSLRTTKTHMAKKPPPKKHKPIQSLLRRMIESLPQPPQAKPVTRRISINRLTDPDMFEKPDSLEVFDKNKIVRVKLSGLPHNEDRYDFQSLISS